MKNNSRFLIKAGVFLLFCCGVLSHSAIASFLVPLTPAKVDFLLAIALGVLTAFLAIWAGHVATQGVNRWIFWIAGTALAAVFVTIGLRAYQTSSSAQSPSDIVMEAVNKANVHTDRAVDKANQHTDEEIGMVRDDLQKSELKSEEHTDGQVSAVRADLKASLNTTGELLAKTETNLNAAISKVGKPDPPEQAKLQFSLWGNGKQDANSPLTFWAMSPDKDGVFSLDWFFVNLAGVAGNSIDLWVYICDDCAYAREPPGFDRPTGLDEHARHRFIPILNPGAAFEKATIMIRPLHAIPTFQIAFNYSCGNCGPLKEPQKATVVVLSLPQDRPFRPPALK